MDIGRRWDTLAEFKIDYYEKIEGLTKFTRLDISRVESKTVSFCSLCFTQVEYIIHPSGSSIIQKK